MATFFGALKVGGTLSAAGVTKLAELLAGYDYFGDAYENKLEGPDAFAKAIAAAALEGKPFTCFGEHPDDDEPDIKALAKEIKALGLTARIALEGSYGTGRFSMRVHPKLRYPAELSNTSIEGEEALTVSEAARWLQTPDKFGEFLNILREPIPALTIGAPRPAPKTPEETPAAPDASGPGLS